MKRATKGGKIQLSAKVISIHALVKRATDVSFNASYIERISIHALVKRATVFTKARYNIDNISIHALVKRATLYQAQA